MSSAGILIIGDEILSGKVVDTNSPYLCQELRKLGVDVEQILTISDRVDQIAEAVMKLSSSFDFVYTSGGVGPTHDDLTMSGIAHAFALPLECNKSILNRIENAQGKVANDSQMKMAMIPKGAELIEADDLWIPVVLIKNVYIFPGIPSLLKKKFESIKERFRTVPFQIKKVFIKERESQIAATLHGLLDEFPKLLVGSYPRIGEENFEVVVTLESRDVEYLRRALDSLLSQLPEKAIFRVE